MEPRLEHANLAVRDLDAITRFIQTALPEFGVRAQGRTSEGTRWVHVGTGTSYIALYEAREDPTAKRRAYDGTPGVNHVGFEVDDAEGVRRRLVAGGYEDSTVPNNHPHRTRVYFYDPKETTGSSCSISPAASTTAMTTRYRTCS